MAKDVERVRQHVRGIRRCRWPPAAHPGRQDGPGRPRPRPEGDRLGVRRPGLRRRHRAAVRHARRGGAAGGGERRAHHRRVVAGRRAPDAGARLNAALRKEGRDDIMIVVGGVIPPSDYDILFKEGPRLCSGRAPIFPWRRPTCSTSSTCRWATGRRWRRSRSGTLTTALSSSGLSRGSSPTHTRSEQFDAWIPGTRPGMTGWCLNAGLRKSVSR